MAECAQRLKGTGLSFAVQVRVRCSVVRVPLAGLSFAVQYYVQRHAGHTLLLPYYVQRHA